MKAKIKFIAIVEAVNIALANVIAIPLLASQSMLAASTYFKWTIFFFLVLSLLGNIFFSHKFAVGVIQENLFFVSCGIMISMMISYIIYTISTNHFNFERMDWIGSLERILNVDMTFYGIQLVVFVAFVAFYISVFDRKLFKKLLGERGLLSGTGKNNRIEANLENSRFMKDEEIKKLFKNYLFSELANVKKDGIPVVAKLTNREKDMSVAFNSPCHSLIIGSTGSGKTTTFVSPMIQLLAATSAGSSMVVTDPKGELFSLHSKFLTERGYNVKVIDLRDTYESYRWNPLDAIWDSYQKYVQAEEEVYERTDKFETSGLKSSENKAVFENLEKWYEFDGKGFSTYDKMILAVKIFKKKAYDEVYEDLNDLVSVLVPVENEKDPMWEKGARAITLAVLLAMLEDSENPELHMTRDKFNFFNLTKILQNSNNDYEELRNYFRGRSPLSKALSLSKQVCDAAESTRASYMSIVYEKLNLFNDAGICALTSCSDFTPSDLANGPTALFLKIPDEKTTRHNLAAIFIMDLYKGLIKIASAREELSLPRNVYYIMDEFGNMPKIGSFDKMITVGRSRKIWFNMIIQSYAQLNNVYGDKVADIVKGNCGIKMFIGSNDMGTCKEYSELCGNITVVTSSTSSVDKKTGISVSKQTQVRPLIYPSELQRLNMPGDIGHSIIVTFGNFPLKTYFTPSFKVPFYKFGKMETTELESHFFDEEESFYDVSARNNIILNESKEEPENTQGQALGNIFDLANMQNNTTQTQNIVETTNIESANEHTEENNGVQESENIETTDIATNEKDQNNQDSKKGGDNNE